jgi:hypothetical protein
VDNKTGRIWHEADISYSDGARGSERIVYSNDGLIFKTNHYTDWVRIK